MMSETRLDPDQRMLFPKVALTAMVDTLMDDGYTVVAPTLHRDVIKLKPITGSHEIARGLRDLQDGGQYRLEAGDETLFFEYVAGPDSAKQYFFPSSLELFSVDMRNGEFSLQQTRTSVPKLAILGLRPCDLAAIRVQDRVFAEVEQSGATHCEAERYYQRVRAESILIAINCTHPGGTCFCDSMGTGPKAVDGFDVAMTELCSGFVVEAGSETGMLLLDKLPLRDPTSAELELADLKMELARERMGRTLDTRNIVGLLDKNTEHPRWDQVAGRCLSCGNCTMVCPTCFCSTLTDSSDLSSERATRTRRWESCFTHQFSCTTTGPHRSTVRARYRHWMRHKLGTWWKQFGTSGCVGCGRCITWCPVGIDLTKEAAAVRGSHPDALQKPVSPKKCEVTE